MSRALIVLISGALALFVGCASQGIEQRADRINDMSKNYAEVNGIRMYYEVHGEADGVPLVLLHGGGSTIDATFGRILPFLSEGRRVIAIEEQGHGRTSDRDAPVRFETSAEDVTALLHRLDIRQADFFGFSNGANVGLQVAIQYPDMVRKLVFASAIAKRDGAPAQLWEFMETADISNMPRQLKDAFLAVNPDPDKLKTMHDKDAERMRNFRDVPDSDLASLRASTLILIGDRDIVKPEHALELARLIPDARLLILPAGHGDYIGEVVATTEESRQPRLTAEIIADFLGE